MPSSRSYRTSWATFTEDEFRKSGTFCYGVYVDAADDSLSDSRVIVFFVSHCNMRYQHSRTVE